MLFAPSSRFIIYRTTHQNSSAICTPATAARSVFSSSSLNGKRKPSSSSSFSLFSDVSGLFAREDDVHGVRLARLGGDVLCREALEPPREVEVRPHDPDVVEVPRRRPDGDRLGGEAPVAERHHLPTKVLAPRRHRKLTMITLTRRHVRRNAGRREPKARIRASREREDDVGGIV